MYPFEMCQAILEGLKNHLEANGKKKRGVHCVMPEWAREEEASIHECEDALLAHLDKLPLGDVLDATTGQVFRGDLVQKARALEMEYFKKKNVYTKRPRAEAIRRTGKPPTTVKWVDVNKGDDVEPNYRSRLVAREIRKKWEDSIFAPTRPLEALRALLSILATKSFWPEENWRAKKDSDDRLQISLIDISRAYFSAKTSEDHPVYVDLPAEDPDHGKEFCGRLNVHMYGTRPAADGWHCE